MGESIPDGMLDDMTMKKRQKDKPEDIDWGEGKKKAPVSLFGDEPEPEEQPRRKKISLKKVEDEPVIKIEKKNALADRAAMLKKKKEEEEKKEQEEAEKIDLRKNLSRRKSSAGAAPEKELTEGELAAKKAKEAQLA